MFKTILIVIITSIISVVHTWTTDVIFPTKVEKKMHRQLTKTFGSEDFHKRRILLSDSLQNSSNAYFYEVSNQKLTHKYFLAITVANGCRVGGCDINGPQTENFEKFYIYSLYTSNGKLIDLRVLDYQGDYGYEVSSRWWLKQFIKASSQKYEYSKNIDAISGATKSAHSVINELNENKVILDYLMRENVFNE